MVFVSTVRPLKQRLQETTERIVDSGRITRADEDFLFHVATSDEVLSPEEIRAVQQVHDRLRMGLLDLAE
ncbi:MAG: hypothetical protein F6K30_01295 [Cyanothece sp. SIO2G6]|nr:hypothetical protein [Cyanothece sp. SIO2G6]